jgi:hypothetical protein
LAPLGGAGIFLLSVPPGSESVEQKKKFAAVLEKRSQIKLVCQAFIQGDQMSL